jgi:hypothetical protein
MALVTIAEVKAIISTDLEDDSITAFIEMADAIVTKLTGSCLTDNDKVQIELNLAAHFLSMSDQRLQAEKTGDASSNYQGSTGMGLDATLYGQAAKLLDCSGELVNLGQTAANWSIL